MTGEERDLFAEAARTSWRMAVARPSHPLAPFFRLYALALALAAITA